MSTARLLKGLEKILEKLMGHDDYMTIEEEAEEPSVPSPKWDGIDDAEDLPLQQGEKSEGMSWKMSM
jgi:hypothetical protein